MNRRRFLLTSLAGAIAAPLSAGAQQAGKIARIGMLASSPSDPFLESFKQGLRELGYVEGRNITIEYRWVEGQNERLPGLAADLVRLKVDVIVASSQGAVAAKQATTEIRCCRRAACHRGAARSKDRARRGPLERPLASRGGFPACAT